MAENRLEITIQAVDKATKEIKQVGRDVDKFSKTFKKSFTELNSKIELFMKAVRGLQQVGKLVKFGAQVEQQAVAFDNLAKKAGLASDVLLNQLKRASGETLSNLEVMQNASKALVLGLDPNQLGKLMEISRASARAFGTDVTKMFDDITTGIGRQSKMILDNLGILFSAEEAYRDYAAILEKDVKNLTEFERRQAFANKTIEKGNEIIASMNLETATNFEAIQQADAAWKDLSGALAVFLANSDVVKAAIENITISLKLFSGQAIADFDTLKIAIGNVNPEIVKLRERLIELQKIRQEGESTARGTRPINDERLIRILEEEESIRQRLVELMREQAEAIAQNSMEQQNEFQRIQNELLQERLRLFEAMSPSLENQSEKMKEMEIQAKRLESQLNSAFSRPLSALISGSKSAKEAFKDMGKSIIDVLARLVAETIVSATIGRAIQATSTALAVTQAKIIETAMRPAAVFSSIATAGGAAAAGTAGIAATWAAAQGLSNSVQIPQLAEGGVVNRPTVALIGERGPEAVVPLDRDARTAGTNITINIASANLSSSQGIAQTAEDLGFMIENELRTARGI